MTPLVTVVIPTWNRRRLVEEAVASVMAQTYPHWELIVIDDGSTDGTAERLNMLKDERVRVLAAPHVGHIGRLRNRGAAAGIGTLIAFLDLDDLWLPQKLELQVQALRETGCAWCYAGFELIDEEARTIPLHAGEFKPLSGRIVRQLLTTEASVAVQSLVVERSLFAAVGRFSEDPRLLVRGDHELHLRLALSADAVAVPETLVRIREHPGRTTSGLRDPYERTARVYEFFLKSNTDCELARLARQLRAQTLLSAGAHQLATGRPLRAAALFASAHPQGVELRPCVWAIARGVRSGLRASGRSRSVR